MHLLDGGRGGELAQPPGRHAAVDRAEERLHGPWRGSPLKGAANVNLANLSSVTPLMAAEFLGQRGAREGAAKRAPTAPRRDRVGKTAMVYAAGLGHTGVVEAAPRDGESSRAGIKTISRI